MGMVGIQSIPKWEVYGMALGLANCLDAQAIKHKHSEAEAEVVGRAEANKVAAFIAGLEAKAWLLDLL